MRQQIGSTRQRRLKCREQRTLSLLRILIAKPRSHGLEEGRRPASIVRGFRRGAVGRLQGIASISIDAIERKRGGASTPFDCIRATPFVDQEMIERAK